MSLSAIKNIVLFLVFWLALFFLSEFILDQVFDDRTPFWKIVAVSLISAAFLVFPIVKKNKDFSLNQVKKKQIRIIEFSSGITATDVFKSILNFLSIDSQFKVISSKSGSINLKSKWSLDTFGERYLITILEKQIRIESKPAIYKLPFDGGQVFNAINDLESKINQILESK